MLASHSSKNVSPSASWTIDLTPDVIAAVSPSSTSPKTRTSQKWPRTSWRLRENAARTERSSTSITGATSANHVASSIPGMKSTMKPTATTVE